MIKKNYTEKSQTLFLSSGLKKQKIKRGFNYNLLKTISHLALTHRF